MRDVPLRLVPYPLLKPLPLHVSARVFDNYLLHGDVFIWRTALGILRMLSPQLLAMPFEDIIKTVANLKSVDEHALFACIGEIQIKPQQFASLMHRLTWDDFNSGLAVNKVQPEPGSPRSMNAAVTTLMDSISSIFRRSPPREAEEGGSRQRGSMTVLERLRRRRKAGKAKAEIL